jgi:hypothetical protein
MTLMMNRTQKPPVVLAAPLVHKATGESVKQSTFDVLSK